MTETVAAFERHLLDHLDDRAAWSAYADYLTEQGEPRGDFMRVQLALEDESLPKAERRALHEEEEELRVANLGTLVGPAVAASSFDAEGRPKPKKGCPKFTFRRGWLWAADLRGTRKFPKGELRQPCWRWLHTLELGDSKTPFAGVSFAGNLRDLYCDPDENSIAGDFKGLNALFATTPRLERLTLPCATAGDRGIGCLINSGLLHRLKFLDLRHGHVTDAGAFALFEALNGTPHMLEALRLEFLALTDAGIQALRRLNLASLDAAAEYAYGTGNYLTQGDSE